MSKPCEPLADRFWRYVFKTAGCWLWTASTNEYGYGKIGRGGRGKGMAKAHRVSWELHNGPITSEQHVLHRCDTPPCVNPAHLFLGDRATNMRDMAVKGRHGGAKLSPELVRQIRVLRTVMSQQRVADLFNITRGTISHIETGRDWVHVQ